MLQSNVYMNFVQPASERCDELLHADCGAGVGHLSYAVAVLWCRTAGVVHKSCIQF